MSNGNDRPLVAKIDREIDVIDAGCNHTRRSNASRRGSLRKRLVHRCTGPDEFTPGVNCGYKLGLARSPKRANNTTAERGPTRYT